MAIKDSGINLVCASSGDKTEYTGDPTCLPYGHAQRLLNNRKSETGLFTRRDGGEAIDHSICSYNHLPDEVMKPIEYTLDIFKDEETALYFKNFGPLSALNLKELNEIDGLFQNHIGKEFIGYGTHEQYSYPDYFAYQSDSEDKLLASAKILSENGYEYFFIEELVENL